MCNIQKSKWCNPYNIGLHGDRDGVLRLLRGFADRVWGRDDFRAIFGKVLLCHCREEEDCHGDILAELADRAVGGPESGVVAMMDLVDDGLPVRISGGSGPGSNPGGQRHRLILLLGGARLELST